MELLWVNGLHALCPAFSQILLEHYDPHFEGKKIRLIFLLGLQNNRRVVLHFSVIKRATH